MTEFNRRTVLGALGAAATLPLVPGVALAQDGPLKIGFVYIGPVGDFGWTYAHEQGRLQLVEELGDAVETTIVENVAEGPDAERIIRQLAQDGNQLIFTTSFGYMNPTIKVAKQFPDVYFEHATGYQRADNVATYNARFYQGRAVIGTIAGMMSETGTAGYIASFPIPEVVMGINAFTLAARKINPDFQTNVVWVSTWYDPAKEADAARALMDQGADMITQHTDSPAALQAAEERGVFAFGQASDMSRFAPTAHLTAIEDHWGPYYVKRAQAVLDGTWDFVRHLGRHGRGRGRDVRVPRQRPRGRPGRRPRHRGGHQGRQLRDLHRPDLRPGGRAARSRGRDPDRRRKGLDGLVRPGRRQLISPGLARGAIILPRHACRFG